MREIHELLDNRWILKKKDPDTYFRLKDSYESYKPFFQEKLGCNIIINPLLIKAEKLPGKAEVWMGIKDFDSGVAYVFLCLLLMFLEEKDPEEQFVLFQVTDYVQNHYTGEDKIDWTVFAQRKTLIKVLRFCMEQGMILINDGDDAQFSSAYESVEVLYENTGASKYFMRRFPYDIARINGIKDFEEMEWQTDERDRGLVRRHRVYRKLVLSPVMYNEAVEDQDYLYVKNQRSVIENDFEKFLDGELHLHRNGAMLLIHEHIQLTDGLPNRKNISDIVLQLCTYITEELSEGRFVRSQEDIIGISFIRWEGILQEVKSRYGHGWSKQYRELSRDKLREEIQEVLVDFGMMRLLPQSGEVMLYPAMGKLTGDYPKDYWAKIEQEGEDGQRDGTVEDQ